ncbi:MAG: LytR/AlgR family response regulator transcription factor, partial [Saprospiraceae bacterium]
MLSAYIIEDEIRAIELLQNYLERIDYLRLVGTARNPLTAFHYLQEHPIDVIFLDINMPILSGLELYRNLQYPPQVIFTTAYPEYAVEGFNLQAVDYLLKPITFPRFLQACERLRQQQKKGTTDPAVATGQFT